MLVLVDAPAFVCSLSLGLGDAFVLPSAPVFIVLPCDRCEHVQQHVIYGAQHPGGEGIGCSVAVACHELMRGGQIKCNDSHFLRFDGRPELLPVVLSEAAQAVDLLNQENKGLPTQ